MTRIPLVAAVAAAALAMCGGTGTAGADPGAPQPGTGCTGLAGALTRLADQQLLTCHDDSWSVDTDTYPSADRWYSYGPELTLSGQGRRNPEFPAGSWTATPQDDDGRCTATLHEVLRAGELAPPRTLAGEPGQPLVLTASAQLFDIDLAGHCLWELREPDHDLQWGW